MSIIWRPKLFSATGAEFQADQTVQDGVHLRWMTDAHMGLPFEKKDRKWGHFQVFEQQSKFPCLQNASLDNLKASTPIPVHSQADTDPHYRLELRGNSIYFLRGNQENANLAAVQLLNQVRSLHSWLVLPEQKSFTDYIKFISKEVKGETPRLQPLLQFAELCAIDIAFAQGTGTVPGGDGSQNPGCLGILDALAEKKYAWVRAYDMQGHLLGEDWIGRLAFTLQNINNPSARNKFSVRFRAAGIHHIAIEPVAGQPVMNRISMLWVFCEEYCNANIWGLVGEPLIRFNANPDAYTPTVLEQRYYSGFKKTLDWSEALTVVRNEVLNTPEMLAFLQTPDTYHEYVNSVTLNDNDPGTPGSVPEGSLPFLPVLLHAATDPAVASLLGLYYHLPEQQTIRDVMIVAHPPFFDPGNLDILYDQFKHISSFNGVPYLVQPRLGFYKLDGKISVQLGGLVLCPTKGVKPSPPAPGGFTTTISSLDLPGESGTVLLVDSVLKIPAPPFSLLPYQSVQAFEVERKIGTGDFINSAEDEDTSLQKIGMLPAVYFPSLQPGAADLVVRDNFMLTLPPEQTVQYRARSFDVFARPSGWGTDEERNIPIPCHPPATPVNLSATVFRVDQQLRVELIISISGRVVDLQAVSQSLEIAVHPVEVNAAGAVEDVEWAGALSARGLQMDYAADRYPDPATAALFCLDLLRIPGDGVQWDAAAAGSCDTLYPPIAPVISLPDDPNVDEALLELRTYRITMALASVASLAEGQHRWCSRVRIRGLCTEGDTVYSRESCTGFRYNMVLPPPPVIQPSGSIIPESTFPDKKGNSYYTVLVNRLVAPVPAGGESLLNVYLIDLAHLEPDLASMVDGNILLAGQQYRLYRLARANKNPFKKMNTEPVPVHAEPSYYSAGVEGTLENYFVLGIVGTNSMQQESSWDKAAILLFKTPKPLPKPRLRFTGISSKVKQEKLVAEVSFRADFAGVITEPAETPVIQVVRKDMNTGASRFAGQATGNWNTAGSFYQFDFRDNSLVSWRHYAYEAILVSKAGEKWVKSDLRATGETTAPGLKNAVPLSETFFAEAVTGATGNTVKFAFSAGDFDFILTKSMNDEVHSYTGKIRNTSISGPAGISLLNSGGSDFILQWLDTEGGEASYALRLFRGQQMPWTNKTSTT